MFELRLPVDRSGFPCLGSALREASGVDNNRASGGAGKATAEKEANPGMPPLRGDFHE